MRAAAARNRSHAASTGASACRARKSARPAALAAALGGLLADPTRAAAIGAAGRDAFLARHAEAPVLAAWDLFLAAASRIRGGSTG